MTRADRAVERAADRLEEFAEVASEKGGPVAKAAPALEEDADFLRKMQPSKVAARVRSAEPGRPGRPPRRDHRPRGESGRVAALAPVAAALALGVLVAKLIDWRSYVEPRG